MRSLSEFALPSALLVVLFVLIARTALAQEDPALSVLRQINRARAEANLPELVRSVQLDAAAQGHANDLLQNGAQLGHRGSDGSSTRTRIARAGFQGDDIGENWAAYRTLEQIVDFWLKDPPHRRNILNEKYSEIGIGVAVRPNGGLIVVTDFGTRGRGTKSQVVQATAAPEKVRPTRVPTRAKPKPTAMPPTRKPVPIPTAVPTLGTTQPPPISKIAVADAAPESSDIRLKVRGKSPRVLLQGIASAEMASVQESGDPKREWFGGALMLSGALLLCMGVMGHRRYTSR